MTTSVDVFHIAFCDFGLAPFQRFADSYRRHPAAADHRLVIAYKGFEDTQSAPPAYGAALDGIAHDWTHVPNEGFDIGTYVHLARRSSAERICLLNSNSVILADAWLAKLNAALDDGFTMAGATGSWESIAADYLRAGFSARTTRPLRALKHVAAGLRSLRFYPAFPNPHLRTNGVLIPRELFLEFARQPASKHEAMCFESGRRGLTRTLLRRGASVAMVTRDGSAHLPSAWPHSAPFRRGSQEQLLIGDNQTQAYDAAPPERRHELSALAWKPF